MKVFVTGVKGQLGHDVVNELKKRNHEAIGVDIEEMDITDKASVDRVIKQANPDAVIHCAAWTAVDLSLIHIPFQTENGSLQYSPLPPSQHIFLH